MPKRWLRGPALNTLIALGGVQPGDEIMIKKRCLAVSSHNYYAEADARFYGKVLTVMEFENNAFDPDPVFPVRYTHAEHMHCTCYCAIKAWRRP